MCLMPIRNSRNYQRPREANVIRRQKERTRRSIYIYTYITYIDIYIYIYILLVSNSNTCLHWSKPARAAAPRNSRRQWIKPVRTTHRITVRFRLVRLLVPLSLVRLVRCLVNRWMCVGSSRSGGGTGMDGSTRKKNKISSIDRSCWISLR